MRVAVIGSGISGLAAAYYLSASHEVTVFERAAQPGGHTHTVTVETSAGPLAIDMGFIVHNDRTYPNLVRLLEELRVPTQASDMSFGVFSRETGFEYSSRGLGGFFAQKRNILRLAHYRLLGEILRFNREAPRLLDRADAGDLSMGTFLERGGYRAGFVDHYLYPMASAVWSMPLEAMYNFPALTLIQFFANHGMLGINTHPQWKTITGGSSTYIAPLSARFGERLRLNSRIQAVSRDRTGVALHLVDGTTEFFDDVVFACHGNQILPLLAVPTEKEQEILGSFRTSRNEACLHTDSRMLPSQERARASWNYMLPRDGGGAVTLTYHMNRLQSIPGSVNYCVTLNSTGEIDPTRILRTEIFNHPIYDSAAIQAQQRWSEISGRNHTHFCGAYWFYGFHEDGLRSAIRVARRLGAAPLELAA